MIHFVWSIFFLILSVLLVLAYILAGVIVILVLKIIWHLYTEYRKTGFFYNARINTLGWLKEQASKWCQSKMILYVLLLVMTFNISIYLKQRVEWMGDDNGNLAAKEYWVAGQVVYAYRNIYCLLKHPDDLFIKPLTWLQEWVYRQGSQQLPENDGEIGVWANTWFVYPFSRKLYITYDSHGYKPSPRMMALMERTWFSLEKQATGEWADSQMKEEQYYRGYPGQAFYYTAKQGFLTGKKVGSRILLAKDSQLLARDQKLVAWLGELQDKWKTSLQAETFINQNPIIRAFLQLSSVDGLSNLIYGSIFSRQFSCESKEVQEYVAFRAEFVGDGSVLFNMRERKQAKRLYNIAVNTMIGRFQSYTLDRFCGIQVAGEEDMKKFTGWSRPTVEHREYKLEGVFNEAVNILEETHNGRK